MRVAVTGATGFVGRAVVRALVARGDEVFAFGRRPANEVELSRPNYRQWVLPSELRKVPTVDATIHCGAAVGQWGDLARYCSVNVEGTRCVMHAFRGVRRCIYVSSASVYASDIATKHIREDAATRAPWATPYAQSKALAEEVVRTLAPHAVILRPRIVYGPDDTTLAPRLRRAVRRGYLLVPGDGRSLISATHIDRLVHAVLQATDREELSGTFNVADDDPCTVDDLLRRTLSAHHIAATIVYVPSLVATIAAQVIELAWRALALGGEPPLTRYVVAGLTKEWTLDTSRSRDAGL